MHKKDLWLRLKAYPFDHIVAPGLWEHVTARFGKADPSVKAFARKIAKKHGWKNNFAYRTLSEYKKFIYLGIISDFQVTPSKMIDIVWHEHLLFSKAYRDFCNEVIHQPFDHHPELLPIEDQTGRFSAQYLDTIELYKKEFDLDPPPEIWGDTKFDKEQKEKGVYQSNKKQRNGNYNEGLYYNEAPLYAYFASEPSAAYPEFTGFDNGDAGGGGANGDWGGSDGGSDSGSDGGGCSGGCGGGGD